MPPADTAERAQTTAFDSQRSVPRSPAGGRAGRGKS